MHERRKIMPRINTYSDNTSIENDDKVLTYDTQAAATKITAFSTIWNWIVSKLHALTSSSAALTPSTDRVLMDKNGTMTRVEPAAVAKYGIETYNGSTIAGSAQTVKAALDALNSNQVKTKFRQYTGVTISAGSYMKVDVYDDMQVASSRFIGWVETGRNFGGIICLQFASEGVYLYCTASVSNGSIGIRYSYI